MPTGPQSLLPYSQVAFTATDGTTYKGNLDAMAAIASNMAGAFYVYPNSPSGMSVLVDGGYNYPVQSVGLSIRGSTPITVALTAPGSNSRFSTIYWDTLLDTAGVVNGVSGVSPGPVMPQMSWQIPLALVLVASTDTSITATAIHDFRNSNAWRTALSKSLGVVTASQTVNCNAATSVSIQLSVQTFINITLTLVGLQVGIPVFVRFDNAVQVTGAVNFKILATEPSTGAAYTVTGKGPSATAAFFLNTTGVSVPVNTVYFLVGNSITGTLNLAVN